MNTTTNKRRTYLALGDSMSIDQYTGVKGGGAVNQFYGMLGDSWKLDDRSSDMNRMRYVPTDAHGDVITMTIGGNDLIADLQRYLDDGLESFAKEHLALLQTIRENNPKAIFIVGNIYAPQSVLPELMLQSLDAANNAIAENVRAIGASLADIRENFRKHEHEYLCYDIEPSHQGATVIANLFLEAYRNAQLIDG
jgi:lysophospholipase L1-like esterase